MNDTKDGFITTDSVIKGIARLCHETNRHYCISIGDDSQATWGEAPKWQKESAIKGVYFHLNNPFAGPEASHESWMEEKVSNGWVYGEEKNADDLVKTHPCIVPFDKLPKEQQMKDHLFKGIVDAYRDTFLESFQGYRDINSHTEDVQADKQLRKDGDQIIQKIKVLRGSAERTLAIRKFQEGVMWLGMDLKRLNEPNPYPNSKDPSTGDKIDPTADGLTL